MTDKFEVITIPPKAPEQLEAMGTKEKFWFRHQQLGLCLYKKARQNTGEDWSEKIAAELGWKIGLPTAEYELATFNNFKGTISKSFLPEKSSLVTGNEILSQMFLDYPEDIQDLSQHTLKNIFDVFSKSSVRLPLNWTSIPGIKSAKDVFIGYLMLDAWIGNSDRHHENWAFIDFEGISYLAPTYDHASCLGRNESDERREQRLTTKDDGFSVAAYARKCRSCIYARVDEKKSLTTFKVFCEGAKFSPQAANIWLDCLAKISTSDIIKLFKRLPDDCISSVAIRFATEILEINRQKLIDFREKL